MVGWRWGRQGAAGEGGGRGAAGGAVGGAAGGAGEVWRASGSRRCAYLPALCACRPGALDSSSACAACTHRDCPHHWPQLEQDLLVLIPWVGEGDDGSARSNGEPSLVDDCGTNDHV